MDYYLILASVQFTFPTVWTCKMFGVFTLAQWNELKIQAQNYFQNNDTLDVYVGSNVTQISSYEEWLGNIEERSLTQSEYDKFNTLFGLTNEIKCWGTADNYMNFT